MRSLVVVILLEACASSRPVVVVARPVDRNATLAVDWSAPTLTDVEARRILSDAAWNSAPIVEAP